MIINKKKYTFPRHFPVKLTQSETFIYRDVIDIPLNNCAVQARYGVSNPIELNQKYIN